LGGDPELRYTQNQKAVCGFSVATTHKHGETEHTEWCKIVCWDKIAENCSKYLTKGRQVMVEGRLQTRSWDDKNGVKQYTTEIIAQNVQFLGQREEANQPQEPTEQVDF
jgi:single-strand DNA-binding protein